MRTPEDELTLRDLLQIVRRRFLLVLAITAAVFVIALAVWLGTTRRYQATGVIRVQNQHSNNVTDMLAGASGSGPGASDALTSDVELQTQAGLLQSNALGLRTVRRLNLQSTRDFRGVTNAEPGKQLDVFHSKLSVKPVGGTSLIEVSYLDPDPQVAAAVVNDLVQELVASTYESQQNSAESSSRALSGQLADLRRRSEELQTQVAQMQRSSGIYSVGTTDPEGRTQAYSAVLAQFERAATVLSSADENRILKQGIAEAAQSGNAELLSSLAGNGMVPGGANGALITLQTLRAQQATLQGQLDQLRVKFGAGYPRVAELQANVSAVERAIGEETQRVAQRAATDYAVADRTYKDAKKDYEQQKVEADALNNRAIKYVITRQEADETRTLYEDLLKRLKEAGILRVLHASTIEIADPAMVPTAPAKPRRVVYLGGGLLAGLFLGLVTALLKELLRDRVESAEDLERLGLPVAGLLGFRHGVSLAGVEDSTLELMLRGLRHALLRTRGTTGPAVVLLCEVTPRDRRWELPLALAQSFARQGKRVLLIRPDDGTPPVQADETNGTPSVTLMTMLSGAGNINGAIVPSLESNLLVLRAGSGQPLAHLLDAGKLRHLRLQVQDTVDVLLVHTAPVFPFAEPQMLAEACDVTLLSVELGETSKKAVQRAYADLAAQGGRDVLVLAEGGGRQAFREFYGYSWQEAKVA